MQSGLHLWINKGRHTDIFSNPKEELLISGLFAAFTASIQSDSRQVHERASWDALSRSTPTVRSSRIVGGKEPVNTVKKAKMGSLWLPLTTTPMLPLSAPREAPLFIFYVPREGTDQEAW